jgi:tRNA (guanine26-N2/guanine27-N2)-dimethyltransferase
MLRLDEFILRREGKVLIRVPNPRFYLRRDGIYEPAWAPIFYNPVMTINRDFSVLTLYTFTRKYGYTDLRVVDALAGVGVRGIRYCMEVEGVSECIVNDVDSRAKEVINENVRINNLSSKVRVFTEDANALLYRLKRSGIKLDYIDVDPFGSPAPFVRSSLWSVRRGGLVAFTATDTGPLTGSRWWAGARRYDVKLARTSIGHEVGLRVLLGYIARRAAEMDRYIIPLAQYMGNYYYRVSATVMKGSKKADEMLDKALGYIHYCSNCEYIYVSNQIDFLKCPKCDSELHLIGPVWITDVSSSDFISSMRKYLIEKYSYFDSFKDLEKLIDRLAQECGLNKIYNITYLSKALKVDIPRLDKVIECLHEKGLRASRTHYGGTYLRTDAEYEDIVECVKLR